MEDIEQRARSRLVIRASAEFIVIVVGVLVAFAVDDWATARENRTDEIQYLEQLAEELRRDTDILDVLILGTERGTAALQRVDSATSGALQPPSDTVPLLLDVLSGRGAMVVRLGTRTAFDELLSTGSLRLIESATLRASIVDYYGEKELAERRIEGMRSEYSAIVQRYVPSAPGGGLPSEVDQRDILRSHGVTRAYQVLLAAGFRESITAQQNFLRLVVPQLTEIRGLAEALTSAIEVQLSGRT